MGAFELTDDQATMVQRAQIRYNSETWLRSVKKKCKQQQNIVHYKEPSTQFS